jgi:hypothetical protein
MIDSKCPSDYLGTIPHDAKSQPAGTVAGLRRLHQADSVIGNGQIQF